LTLYLTGRRSSSMRTIFVVGAVVAIGALSLANFEKGIDVADDYFAVVDKANANSGRLDLWNQGISRWREAPIFGSGFAGEVTAVRERDGRVLPFHNDFVLFLAAGGAVGFGLLIGWFVIAEVTLLRRYRGFARAGQSTRAGLLRAILVCLNGFLVAMAFNPVLPGASRSATIFGLYGIAMSIGEPKPVDDDDESTEPGALSGSAAPSA